LSDRGNSGVPYTSNSNITY